MKYSGVFIILVFIACQSRQSSPIVLPEVVSDSLNLSSIGKTKLSDYDFFKGALQHLEPNEGVIAYSLNSALFSDYAFKKRFVSMPKGNAIGYHPTDVLEFPEGTVLIKNFYYPADFRKPDKEKRIIETRLLILENAEWKTLPYIWNEQQTEAYLEVAGKSVDVEWIHFDGNKRKISYSIPNINQCKGCHLRGDKVMPIGPTARQLNHKEDGGNLLTTWQAKGVLKNLPAMNEVPRLAAYENENENVAHRARAWLEINCAHCHRADGPAKTSGLHLLADVADLSVLGVGKAPIAAGKGSGGRLYGIVPGKPEESILQYRIESTHPGIMMPELGRKLVHEEGVALVRQWILELR
jgi:uncharacterized repeat protein (TIGR03806 family)